MDGLDSEPGKDQGTVVVTGLMNDAMPLIRYDMGDIATLVPGYQCPCGRRAPVIERIDGRSESLRHYVRRKKSGAIQPCVHGALLGSRRTRW